MSEKIDPELVDDREVRETELPAGDLPEYDPSDFELPDDYEYVEEEDGEDDGSSQ